jgi:protein-tyrosine phosphatase
MADQDFKNVVEIPLGLPGRLYRSPMPFSMYDDGRDFLSKALAQGVNMIVNLVPDDEARQKSGINLNEHYAQLGLRVLHMPVPDFGIPETAPLRTALEQTLAALQQGDTLLVHCHAGLGRTGTFLGCLGRIHLGLDGPQAVTWIRQYIPMALENEQQIGFVKNFQST